MHNDGVKAVVPTPNPEPARRFFVEIHDDDGVPLAHLEYALLTQRQQMVNSPSRMTIIYPLNDDKTQYFVWPNRVLLFERIELDPVGTLVEVFDIAHVTTEYAPENRITVSLESQFGQLVREKIQTDAEGYTVDTDTPVSEIISDWLDNFQDDKENKHILLGHVADEVGKHETTLKLNEGISILAALKSVQRITGGYFWVDAQRRLQWRVFGLGSRNFWITTGRDLSLITERLDNRRRANELHVYGKGSTPTDRVLPTGGNPIKGPNWGTGAGQYKIRQFITYPAVEDPDELLRRGEIVVNRNSLGTLSYSIAAIDLKMADTGALNFQGSIDQIRLGNQVHINDTESGKQIDAIITSILDVPDDPLNVKLTVHDPTQGDPTITFGTPLHPQDEYTEQEAIADLFRDREEKDLGDETGGGGGGDSEIWEHIDNDEAGGSISIGSLRTASEPASAFASATPSTGDFGGYVMQLSGSGGAGDWCLIVPLINPEDPANEVSSLPEPEYAAFALVRQTDPGGDKIVLYYHCGVVNSGTQGWIPMSHTEPGD